MSEPKLMTVQEFNAQVLRWAEQVRSRARMTLRGGTHGSGHLADKLQEFVDTAKHLRRTMLLPIVLRSASTATVCSAPMASAVDG